LAGQVFKATLGIPVLPVIEKPWGDVVAANELGYGTDPAQELLNNPAFKVDCESSAMLHDKIFSVPRGCLVLQSVSEN
jgi:hypothetical protein